MQTERQARFSARTPMLAELAWRSVYSFATVGFFFYAVQKNVFYSLCVGEKIENENFQSGICAVHKVPSDYKAAHAAE